MMETLGYILVWSPVLFGVMVGLLGGDALLDRSSGWLAGAFILGIILIWIF